MSKEELITLMDLLQKYSEEEVEPSIKQNPETKTEYLLTIKAQQHKRVIKEICECIVFGF